MNLENLLKGAAFGALIALGVTVWDHYRAKPMPPMVPIVHTGPAFSAVASPVERNHGAQDAWFRRRDAEFDKCAALHGTPTLGFGMRVVCLDSRAVTFLGEEHPPY